MKAIEIRDHRPEKRHDRKLFKRIAGAIAFTPLIFKIKSIEETERVFRQHTLQLGDGD